MEIADDDPYYEVALELGRTTKTFIRVFDQVCYFSRQFVRNLAFRILNLKSNHSVLQGEQLK